MAKWLTRRPLLYNAVNLMADELASYRFIRPASLAHGLARGLDWFTPIFPNHITAVSPQLRTWFIDNRVPVGKLGMDFISSNHDCEALGRGIVTLLNDRKLAAELAANARATVLANFDWRDICAKNERIYERLLGEPESRDIQSEHDALARSQP
jgi:glycosyltransferase involved in cell wall biosynthesis